MPKEYRTIEEVAGPLMLVRDVTDVNYNELGEIELASGEKGKRKRCNDDGRYHYARVAGFVVKGRRYVRRRV